jgi:K+-sensing histidine kinase KdpD
MSATKRGVTALDPLLAMRAGGRAAWTVALAGLAAATAARAVLDLYSLALAPFLFYFPVVLLAGLAGGFRVAATTAVVAELIAWYAFIPPRFAFSFEQPVLFSVAGFLVVALLIAWVASRLRQTDAALRELNAALEARVAERGRALQEEAARREEAEARAR